MQDMNSIASLTSNRITLPDGPAMGDGVIASNPVSGATSSDSVDFASVFDGALSHVSGLQESAGTMQTAVEMGVSEDLVGTMIASQKASLSFQATIQVRNRIVSAYETVFNMPV